VIIKVEQIRCHKGIPLLPGVLMHKISMYVQKELSKDTAVKKQPDPKSIFRQGISF